MPEPTSPLSHGQLRTLTRDAWRFKREIDWNSYYQQFRPLFFFGMGCKAYILLDEWLDADGRSWMKRHPSRATPIICWVLPYKEEDMEVFLSQSVSFVPEKGVTLVQVPDWLKLVELRQFPFPQPNGTPTNIIPLNIPTLKLPPLPH